MATATEFIVFAQNCQMPSRGGAGGRGGSEIVNVICFVRPQPLASFGCNKQLLTVDLWHQKTRVPTVYAGCDTEIDNCGESQWARL